MNRLNIFKKYRFVWQFLVIVFIFFLSSQLISGFSFFSRRQGQVEGFRDLLPTPALYPVNQNLLPGPELSAKSVMILDADSGVTLFEKEPDLRLLPASTTKVMTGLIALEHYRPDQILTIGNSKIDGSVIGLFLGEQLTVDNLLYGLLVGSGNDAAQVLAENFPQGVLGFVWAMNQKAKELGLKDTHFTNPAGLDEDNHYSTARDLALLTVTAVKNPVFARIVSTSGRTITDTTGEVTHYLQNTNELVLEMAEVKGVKTGWTQNAGECLVSLIEKNQRRIVVVLLGSSDRFGETKEIINWVFENFTWLALAPTSYR